MDETPSAGRRHHTSYYGDVIRGLFIAAAIVMLFSGFTSVALPTSVGLTIAWMIALVIIAGLGNAESRGVQWTSTMISALGVIVFGAAALSRYHTFVAAFTDGILIVILTLIFLLTLYFSSRMLRKRPA
jgi:hypothetical protein